jgi:hypothetical protein
MVQANRQHYCRSSSCQAPQRTMLPLPAWLAMGQPPRLLGLSAGCCCVRQLAVAERGSRALVQMSWATGGHWGRWPARAGAATAGRWAGGQKGDAGRSVALEVPPTREEVARLAGATALHQRVLCQLVYRGLCSRQAQGVAKQPMQGSRLRMCNNRRPQLQSWMTTHNLALMAAIVTACAACRNAHSRPCSPDSHCTSSACLPEGNH